MNPNRGYTGFVGLAFPFQPVIVASAASDSDRSPAAASDWRKPGAGRE